MKFKHSLHYTEKDFENLNKTLVTLASGLGSIAHKIIDNNERARVQENAQRQKEKEDKMSESNAHKIKTLEEEIKRLKKDNSPRESKKGFH
jgi:hypothetical protein